MKKTIRHIPAEGHLQATCLVLLKTVKVVENKERLWNCHSPEEPQETGLNVMWHLNGILEQKKDIREKLRESEQRTDFRS